MLHSICQQIWKTQQWPQDWKRSVFFPIPKKGNVKECSNYRTITLISLASTVMLKILHAKLQQYVNHELPDVRAGFRKGRVRGASSAPGKGHEEGGSAYAKAGSSLRSPPGNPRASTPITRACLLYYFVLSPTPLTLRGAVPHHLFRRRS